MSDLSIRIKDNILSISSSERLRCVLCDSEVGYTLLHYHDEHPEIFAMIMLVGEERFFVQTIEGKKQRVFRFEHAKNNAIKYGRYPKRIAE